MKKITLILGIIFMTSCSSTRFVDSWKNEEIVAFRPKKLLVIGMTDNLTARKIFEEELKKEFTKRGINAHESTTVLEESFTDAQRSEREIEMMKEKLVDEGFDAVAITAVVGVDDKRNYRSDYYTFGYDWYRFGRYYYRFQRVYYTPGYYNDYKVYHVETSIYNIEEDTEKSLVWVGTLNIVDPYSITATVNDYVARITKQLEREGIIDPL
ncbi:hypothetical protein FK220_010165 [Flavobacteriaceae bacterium TP-CH-4]|uniref:DUF4136 domain-containing protein n=1 Tax=Pelagihabitans pacificus TaxID=2696054 RepID=A0A967ATL9_9FLAO|nr:hypothetical protein [Pelagihabitans pacificus]NHF59707.1 hypothetical protein [Pelagihabitans pacificus]